MFSTPVLLIAFNRPDLAREVFKVIRKIKPTKLFYSVDGPRSGHVNDSGLVEETRGLIDEVDWPCEVYTRFYEINQGCKVAVSSAVTWFFQHVDDGIILEDDCVPDESFFDYCRVLLERYRNEDRVAHIGGLNLQNGIHRGISSYYFSQHFHVWGWATWRRAWNHYDVNMTTFPRFVEEDAISLIFDSPVLQKFWLRNFQHVYDNRLDTWDYQWVYANISRGALSIIPNVNLVNNIGFGENATHTQKADVFIMGNTIQSIKLDQGPGFILQNCEADNYTNLHHLNIDINPNVYSFCRNKINKVKRFLSKCRRYLSSNYD